MNSTTGVDEEDDVGNLFKLPPDRVDSKNDEEEADDNNDFTSLLETYTNNVILFITTSAQPKKSAEIDRYHFIFKRIKGICGITSH